MDEMKTRDFRIIEKTDESGWGEGIPGTSYVFDTERNTGDRDSAIIAWSGGGRPWSEHGFLAFEPDIQRDEQT